ncbi:hypothetical protein B0H16DRAFT_1613566 [Mycena metata]|uniref:Uncharacterized protein n=1 Tax=Mycena metata TaxID=1033252 RepID=A0AAD7HBF9_9AGAR|nr:hypothetical protein B0H16DRAFT_1613566 [Mycena metata]
MGPAAPPCQKHVNWAGKVRNHSQFCVMRPWSIEELFAGASLQSQPCSGREMVTFLNRFGGSARHVYKDSDAIGGFGIRVNAAARRLNSAMVDQALSRCKPVAVEGDLGHMLLTPLPLDDTDRTRYQQKSPTAYLEGKLLAQLDHDLHVAQRWLCLLNICIGTPGCKAVAAELLHKHHYSLISLGGQWSLHRFHKSTAARSKSASNIWCVENGPPSHVLTADGKMAITRALKSARKSNATKSFKPLTLVDFPLANRPKLTKNHYYRPTDSNFSTFDSFYLDQSTHGLISRPQEVISLTPRKQLR